MAKDLSRYMNRDLIKVICGRRGADPTIEELTLEYLDKADRLRVQAEMIRELLGTKFQMKPYPAALKRPHLAVWGNADLCVVAHKHERGGFQPMADAELLAVAGEVRQYSQLFFA